MLIRMTEEWRPVVGFEGYDVSDQGRVRSWRTNAGKLGLTCRLLRPSGQRYLHVALARNGRMEHPNIHVLVLEAFVGPRPQGSWACHGPNGAMDNSVSNLYWATPSRNLGEDKYRDGTMPLGGQHGSVSPLTEAQVLEIRHEYASGARQTALAGQFVVSQVAISGIVRRKTWRHI